MEEIKGRVMCCDAVPHRRFFHFDSMLLNNQTAGDGCTGVGMIF
jgi:hypothetical protein